MKAILLLTLLTSITFAQDLSPHFKEKITEIVSRPFFNGSWRDSWGKNVQVTNNIYFPAACKITLSSKKSGESSSYSTFSKINFANKDIVEIKKSGISASVKILLNEKLVTSSITNSRTGEIRRNKEKVASFFYRPQDRRDYYIDLIDALNAYWNYCQKK